MMCFRLKSSPPKKTLRLRCFFFMAPVPGLNREAAPRTNQFIRVFRRSRKQLERVLRWPGQEGRRVPADPGLVACAEIGGERIGALAPRHVENALLLVSRGDDEALARSVRGFLDARHVRIPGEGIGGDGQPEGRPAREAAGERGPPLHPLVLAPGRAPGRGSAGMRSQKDAQRGRLRANGCSICTLLCWPQVALGGSTPSFSKDPETSSAAAASRSSHERKAGSRRWAGRSLMIASRGSS